MREKQGNKYIHIINTTKIAAYNITACSKYADNERDKRQADTTSDEQSIANTQEGGQQEAWQPLNSDLIVGASILFSSLQKQDRKTGHTRYTL